MSCTENTGMKRSAEEKRPEPVSGAELVTIIGLLVYSSVACLGLFINAGFSDPLLYLWLAGFVFLVLTISYNSYLSPKPLNKLSFLVLGVIALNLLVQVNGGVHSFLWSIYFLYAALIAALFPQRWTLFIVGLILVIETANLIVPRQPGEVPWAAFSGFLLSLICVAGAVTLFRAREQRTREAHERLIADASAVDPLSDDTDLRTITQESRQAANVSAALERRSAFDGLVSIIDHSVHAHTYALFLQETRGEGAAFVLRAIKSREEGGVSRAGDVLAGDTDTRTQPNIIATCAREKRTYYYPELNFPAMNLGYYRKEVPVRSFLALPIVQEGGAIGVLAVDSLQPGAFSPETQDILESSAAIFLQIIRNIQTSQGLDIKASYFGTLHKMSMVLNTSLELGEVLQSLAGRIGELAPHDLCVFLQYDAETREAVVLHSSGSVIGESSSHPAGSLVASVRTLMGGAEKEKGTDRFPVERSGKLNQMVKQWETGRVAPLHEPDLGDRGKSLVLFGDTLRPRQALRSLSSWPLLAGDKFVGACFLGSVAVNAFSDLQIGVLDTLMNQVAVVMENALLHRQMSERALTDGLTGLLNHRTFMEKLTEELNRFDREPQPFSLLLLDIDHFKKVNDTYGHPVGDEALRTVAGIVRKSVRAIDHVARYGGEEFAVGLVGADEKGAEQMAERIRKTVEKTPVTAEKSAFFCTLSIGAATLRPEGERKEGIIARADAALYHAKRSGRNRVCPHEKLTETERAAAVKASEVPTPAPG